MAYRTEDIVSRAQWGAQVPKGFGIMKTPVKIVFIHHTAGKHSTTRKDGAEIAKEIQKYHMEVREWDDIGYNFLVNEGGHVFEARGWDQVGAHTKGWNAVSVAFSVMGNFDETKPDPRVLQAILGMIQLGIDSNRISKDYKLYGHRDVGATACPGKHLYDIIKTWDKYSTEKPTK